MHTVIVVSNHAEIVGGGEISLLTLLKSLDCTAWAPLVVIPAEGELAVRCRSLGIPTQVLPLPGLRRPGPGMLQTIMALMRLARQTGAALFHANGTRAMFYAGLAARLLDRPVIWHLRIWRSDPKLDWLLARLATRTIAISEVVKARLQRWPRAHSRCVVVSNGLDLEAFRSQTDQRQVRESLQIPADARLIGTVGRLVPEKGHAYLLEAIAQLRRHCPSLWLLVVGDGPERATLEQKARELGIANRTHFTGHRTDIPDLLSAMEVFILPSVAEEFGRVLIEAMAMERPVVATAAGGVPEVVEEHVTGLLVRPADPSALADSVQLLLTDPLRAQIMGKAGRQRVETHFTSRLHAQRIEQVYAEVLAECN